MCGVVWLCFLVWEKWSFGAVVYVPAVHSLLATRALCTSALELYAVYALCIALCGLCRHFCCGRLTNVSGLIGVADPLASWLPNPAFVWSLLATSGWGWVTKWLAVDLGTPGLLLTYSWVEPGPRMTSCKAGSPGSSVSLLVGGTGFRHG